MRNKLLLSLIMVFLLALPVFSFAETPKQRMETIKDKIEARKETVKQNMASRTDEIKNNITERNKK
jgi:hypothetical protein